MCRCTSQFCSLKMGCLWIISLGSLNSDGLFTILWMKDELVNLKRITDRLVCPGVKIPYKSYCTPLWTQLTFIFRPDRSSILFDFYSRDPFVLINVIKRSSRPASHTNSPMIVIWRQLYQIHKSSFMLESLEWKMTAGYYWVVCVNIRLLFARLISLYLGMTHSETCN